MIVNIELELLLLQVSYKQRKLVSSNNSIEKFLNTNENVKWPINIKIIHYRGIIINIRLMDYKLLLSIFGTLVSVFNNVTPSLAIYSRRKSDDIDQVPSNYLKINHFCSLCWLLYSIFLQDVGLILVNACTSLLSLVSILIYAFYAKKLLELYPQYLIGLLALGSFCLAMVSTDNLGITCTVFNIITSLACLESIYQVVSTNNYLCIDFRMAFSNLLSGGIWTVYGVVIKNWNLIISNSVLVLIALNLIGFYAFYRLFRQAHAYSLGTI